MEAITAIRERRSINFFDPDRKLPDSILNELLTTANLSPSSFNLQPWKVVVVQDAGDKKRLRKCAMDQPKIEEASVVLIMVADPSCVEENVDRMLNSWAELGYMKPEMKDAYRGVVKKLYDEAGSTKRNYFAVKNTALFAMNLMLTAKAMGLETHPMDGFDEDCIKKEFSIPQDKIVPMLVGVGYLKPGITLLPRAFRREVDEFVKFGSWK
ncbi:MAG: nitroreductase family protein [Nitrospiraceae bacterium]|nr:nitroreductase family protein [Nitrospiraceae bacterium]